MLQRLHRKWHGKHHRAITNPVKVNESRPQPMACVNCPNGPAGPMATSR